MTVGGRERMLAVLRHHVGDLEWELRPVGTRGGATTFLATGSGRRLFVKWPTDTRPLQRLAELNIVPPIVATGQLHGAPYVVQQYMDHVAADRTWLRTHATEVAAVMRRYQYDPSVQMSLMVDGPVRAEELRRQDLHRIDMTLRAAVDPAFHRPAVLESVERFLKRGWSVPSNAPTATHGDPNPHNFLRTDTGLLLIDWDGAEMSEPMRDLGPFLWWCLPPERWPNVLAAHHAGVQADHRSIEWWAARASLLIAAWLNAHTTDHGRLASFLHDFVAAETGAGNPRLHDP
jgi:aminoglycoside phosphotransferase (APT) family kinase protein